MKAIKFLLLFSLSFTSCDRGSKYFPYKTNKFIITEYKSFNLNSCTYHVKNDDGEFFIDLPCNFKIGDTLYLRAINCK